ncbi:peptidoglycan-binding protein LysM [Brachybacterium endophyticum]|uniref:Peptidoglycan-binding protein LysM n=1 Tax=Brachybacterium endophyticum TaxID=2182385 RepID=A0A2U2RLR0_9MICO|nr:LysM peptidoglycan-binding domain-containing protein [Brachybacterium endophyticum]PWH06776.1 peptidoglycan-binding protein LysM [Brachybacterium endophyticum]
MATVLPLPASSARREQEIARKGVRLQLTRRGRILLASLAFLAGILVALAGVLVLDVPSAFAGDAGTSGTVTVRAGDTLSEYAEQYAPEGQDTQDFVREISSVNGLSSPRITEGQVLELPDDAVDAA